MTERGINPRDLLIKRLNARDLSVSQDFVDAGLALQLVEEGFAKLSNDGVLSLSRNGRAEARYVEFN